MNGNHLIPEVSQVADAARIEALHWMFAGLAEIERGQQVESLLAQERLSAGHELFVLRCGSPPQPLGVVAAMLQPGSTASVWGPRVDPTDARIAAALGGALDGLLQRRRAAMAQALVADASTETAQALKAMGFIPVGDLLYLAATVAESGKAAAWPALEFFACDEPDALARLGEVVRATYDGTLDCPALHDARSASEILEGYRGSGDTVKEGWLIARRDGRDAGCLLLTDHPQLDQYELTYMGVLPAERGQGLGMPLVHEALRRTACAGRSRLVLAVDAANAPARAHYARAGFITWAQRTALVRMLPGTSKHATGNA